LYPEAGADAVLWGEVLGIDMDGAESLDHLPADVRQARFFNLVRQCFQNAARLKPLFIALEDIHWADQVSLDLIDALADYLQDSPIFIVVTYRPAGEPDLDLLNRPICIPVSLVDLSPAKAREMTLSLLAVTELPLSVERHLGLRDRDGLSSPVNPLFLEEALRVMLENKDQAADWLERDNRDEEERTELLVDLLGLKAGDVAADIGAGSGYFTRRLSKRVGPAGRVLAVDIQPEMLMILTNKLASEGLTNVQPILGTLTDPRLPAAGIDLVLLVDVYHEFSDPYEMMEGICRGLKPGGRVAFVEYRGEDPDVPIKPLHKMTEAQVKKEMSAQPLAFVETIAKLPRQHLMIFRKKGP
jgi:ubiquinone/menaquinone biosynthesis C-methylase UbiE